MRILGVVDVVGPDGSVTLRGRLGCVVASLVAHRCAAVPVDVLVDDVFGEHPPASARSTLYGYVHRVRTRTPNLIESTRGGYRLAAGVDVDADRFEEECRSGHLARAAADLETACRSFEAALARWHGPAYADYCDHGFAEAEAAGLEEVRRTAEDARLEVLAQSRPAAEVVAELERSVASEPSREIRWTLLVEALSDAGRLPDAVRAAERYRHLLRDEYGVAPTPAFEARARAATGTADLCAPTSRLNAIGSPDEISHIISEARALHETPVVPASVAAEAALAAADRLVALGSLGAADEWLDEVIATLGHDDPRRSARAHLTRADLRAHCESGDWLDSALTAARLAEDLDDTDLLVRAALLNPSGVATGSSDRIALVRRALDRIPAGEPERPLLLAQLGLELSLLGHGERVIEGALASASGCGDDAMHAEVTAALLNDSGHFLTPGERGVLAAELDAFATLAGRGDASWLAAAHRYWSAVQRASSSEASDALDAVVGRVTGRREMAGIRHAVSLIQAIDAFIAGRLDDADRLLPESEDGGTGHGGDIGLAEGNRQGVLLRLRREQGRLADLVDELDRPVGRFAALLAPSALALVLAELGRLDEARVELGRCCADSCCPPLYLPHVWSVRVEAAVLLGDAERATADARRLEPYAGQVLCGTRGCDGAVDRYLGLAAAATGDHDAADRWFARSTAIHERLMSPTYLARTLCDRAHWLGDADAAAQAVLLARHHRLPALMQALGTGHDT